jgi:cell filamentation protein
MDQAEYELLVQTQERYLHRIEANTRFTAALLRQMHRDWLGSLYAWAGWYRTVELSKSGFQWPPALLVAENMTRLEAGLLRQHTPCRPGPTAEIARKLAEVHADLLLIHPFRDGNGRLARWLADLMALQADLSLPDYGFEGRGAKLRRAQYLAAVRRGYLQEYDPLADFFRGAIERRQTRAT